MVRDRVRLRVRVMDFKPAPQQPRGIGFADFLLKTLAESGGTSQRYQLDLLALGDVVTTYGNKTSHGQPLLGYKDPTVPAHVVLFLEMLPPPHAKIEGMAALGCLCVHLPLDVGRVLASMDYDTHPTIERVCVCVCVVRLFVCVRVSCVVLCVCL